MLLKEFNRYASITTITFLLLFGFVTKAYGKDVDENDLSIKLSPLKLEFSKGGPVGYILSIKNISTKNIRCDICEDVALLSVEYNLCNEQETCKSIFHPRFSNTNLISFDLNNQSSIKNRTNDFTENSYLNRSYAPKILAPEQEYSTSIYLNKFISFATPGSFDIPYLLNLTFASSQFEPTKITSKGILHFNIVEVSKEVLDKELSLLVKEISNVSDISDNQQTELENHILKRKQKMEALEALLFLDSEVAVKYLGKLIDISDITLLVLRSLARINTSATQKLIEDTIFSYKETNGAIVKFGLDILARQKVKIPSDKLNILLSANRKGTRCAAIDYISQLQDTANIALLQPLLADQDLNIKEKAAVTIKQLEVSNSVATSLKNSNNYLVIKIFFISIIILLIISFYYIVRKIFYKKLNKK